MVWSFCPKRLFSGLHLLTMSICETVPQFSDSLMTQFNKGKGWEQIRKKVGFLSLKIQEATSKSVAITEKKGKHYVTRIIYTKRGHLLTKGLPVIDEPITQCDSLVVENTFVGDCKSMIKMRNSRCKLLQINFDVNTFVYCLGTNFDIMSWN